jgi:hypothetical protein
MIDRKYSGTSYWSAEVAWYYFAKDAGYQLYSVEHKMNDTDAYTRFFLKRGDQILDWYVDANNAKNLYKIDYDKGVLDHFVDNTISQFGQMYLDKITDWDKEYFKSFE